MTASVTRCFDWARTMELETGVPESYPPTHTTYRGASLIYDEKLTRLCKGGST